MARLGIVLTEMFAAFIVFLNRSMLTIPFENSPIPCFPSFAQSPSSFNRCFTGSNLSIRKSSQPSRGRVIAMVCGQEWLSKHHIQRRHTGFNRQHQNVILPSHIIRSGIDFNLAVTLFSNRVYQNIVQGIGNARIGRWGLSLRAI